MRVGLLTVLALVAFASNSILCRTALAGSHIDPATFTLVRIVSGALALLAVGRIMRRAWSWRSGSWVSGAALFSYAAAFSFAYVNLSAGTGGLILFACVQIAMIGYGIARGERPGVLEWLGLIVAQVGLIVLVAPGLQAPNPAAALLMALAGVSWGAYSLRGKTASDPTLATGGNFVRAAPFALVVWVAFAGHGHASAVGIALAATSGAVTSGFGYAIWYSALPSLTATRAAIAQLAVPALVAIGGVTLLSEHVTARFGIASAMMLGGVAMAALPKVRLVCPHSVGQS